MRLGNPGAAVVVGGSAGSLAVVETLLSGLSADFPLPIVIVMHTSARDTKDTLWLLADNCRLLVREAVEREAVTPGVVYLAAGQYHLLIERDAHFSLSADPRVRYSRPSIDVLFESAADVYRSSLIACVLTGANDDGAAGAARIKALGGKVLVQSPDESEAATMPAAAIAATATDWVGPADAMAGELVHQAGLLSRINR